jgi:hypothetical protein
MKTTTYFLPTANAVTLYHDDGKTPFSYWHIIYRPAGAINASANDMAAYVQFYLNRGTVNGVQVAPAADIDRMESPVSTWAAREGLKAGYGLSNYWTVQDGFVYHGHDGGVEGGLTEMAYMPENGVGYFYSINSGSGDAFGKIGKAIRNYVTLKLQKPVVPAAAALPDIAALYAGWYVPDSPRVEMTHFLRIGGISHVAFRDGKMTIRGVSGGQTFVPVGGRFFRYVPKDGSPEPVATVALLSPNNEGVFIQAGETMRRIPAWLALGQIALTGFVVLAIVSIPLYALFWLIGGFIPRRRRPAERAMRMYPLAAFLSLVLFVCIFMLGSSDVLPRFGALTGWSASLFVSTLLFAAAVLLSTWAAVKAAGDGVRRGVRWYSGLVSVALLIALLYLAWWGVIGIRTWA